MAVLRKTVMERAVIFQGARGNNLYGIIHEPERRVSGPRIGISILNPGVKNRVAPNRINLRLARLLTERGFPVLRFDAHGVGDSEGEILEGNQLRMNVWSMIQRGLFVPDTLAANDFFVRESNLDGLILVGQCGGANTAAMAADQDKKVVGVVLVDLPARILESSTDFSASRMDMMESKEILALGGSKIFSIRAWVNLFTFKSSLWFLPKVVFRKLRKNLPVLMGKKAGPLLSERFNRELLQACVTNLKKMNKVLFLFAERDYALKEFQSDLKPALEHELSSKLLSRIEHHVIKDANHIYTEKAWQDTLFGHIFHYLEPFRGDIAQ